MNLQDAAFSIFPGCTVMDATADEGLIEVRGSTGAMVPQNCEVLASGVFQYSSQEGSRMSYLVKVDGLFLMVRILPDAKSRLYAQIRMKPAGNAGGARLH